MHDPNADDATMKSSGKAVSQEEQNPLLQGMARKKKWPRWFWPVGLVAIALLLFYFWQVFMAAFVHTQLMVPGHYVPRKGVVLPVQPEEQAQMCIPVYQAARMTPYADSQGEMHRFPEFREHGNIWFLDSGRTEMFEADLLKHPNCLAHLLQLSAASRNRVILVIYDKATKSDVLVIRNYP